MTELQEATVVSQAVDGSAEAVYAFARQMENLPLWASGLAKGIAQRDGDWFADSPMGQVKVTMAPVNPFGVLDHEVTLPDGTRVHNAFRVTPCGDGSLLTFIVLRSAGTSQQSFDSDVAHVRRDLMSLKQVIEQPKFSARSKTQDISAFALPAPDIAPWRAGNTGVEGVWRFDAGTPGRHVMITALVHGNELCGAWALKGLLEAGVRPRRGTLTLALCNLAAFDRFDAANHDASRFVDEDLNRQWSPERLAQPVTLERRRAAEIEPFVREADWLLDLHSMHERGLPLTLSGLRPENIELAVRMKAAEHIVVDAGHKDGIRMRDHGRFGNADGMAAGARSLLVECGFHGDLSSRDVAQDQCLRFLLASDIVDEADLLGGAHGALPAWRLPDAAEPWILDVTAGVVARDESVEFVRPFKGLEVIPQAGTVIGMNGGEAIVTPYDDCVLVMPSLRQARAGVTVVRFAHRRRSVGATSPIAGIG
ncbi:MAG: succinylglutamate desuccinylase [Variovorax sp.]|nr:succinylglutamate desuccinylase [Variovorax sp.]